MIMQKNYIKEFIQSDNYNNRNKDATISGIIIHHTATTDLKRTIDILTKKEMSQVSAHFLIDKNGDVYQFVDTDKKAWHAGVSNWRDIGQRNEESSKGNISCNHTTIGIEVLNDGIGEAFTDAQYKSIISICKEMKKIYYTIDDKNIVGHSDIAPGRKVDPHVNFNWKLLFENGIGIYSDAVVEKVKQIYSKGQSSNDIAMLRAKLEKFGFSTDSDALDKSKYDEGLDHIITSFKRHHCPESYDEFNIYGWDNLAEVRLDDLLHKFYI